MTDENPESNEARLEGELKEAEREIKADEARLGADEQHKDEILRELAEERKPHEIVVNGRTKTVREDDLTFEAVIALAFNPVPTGPNTVFTVTYWHPDGKHEGTLTAGESVEIKNGMVFNVTATDKS